MRRYLFFLSMNTYLIYTHLEPTLKHQNEPSLEGRRHTTTIPAQKEGQESLYLHYQAANAKTTTAPDTIRQHC